MPRERRELLVLIRVHRSQAQLWGSGSGSEMLGGPGLQTPVGRRLPGQADGHNKAPELW